MHAALTERDLLVRIHRVLHSPTPFARLEADALILERIEAIDSLEDSTVSDLERVSA